MAEKKSTMYDLEAEKIREKIIIFAVDAGGYTQKEVSLEVQASLDELAELIDTAGGEVVGRLVQNREKIAKLHLSFADLSTVIKTATELIADNDSEGEIQTPATT